MYENFEYSNIFSRLNYLRFYIKEVIKMKDACKEWSSAREALGKGQIITIWRKGGLEDSPSVRTTFTGFNIEQKQFVLFPTGTHQSLDKIKPEWWSLNEDKTSLNKDNQVKVKYWALVEEAIEIETADQLLSMSNELINTNEHLVSSLNLYPDHKGKVLLLRVYKLTDPILVPYSQDYSGCKSWIELKIDVPKIGSIPVLSFKEFNAKIRFIKALIEQPSIPEKLLAS